MRFTLTRARTIILFARTEGPSIFWKNTSITVNIRVRIKKASVIHSGLRLLFIYLLQLKDR